MTDPTPEEIKPCPFCGSEGYLSEGAPSGPHEFIYHVYCATCDADGPTDTREWRAVNLWNEAPR